MPARQRRRSSSIPSTSYALASLATWIARTEASPIHTRAAPPPPPPQQAAVVARDHNGDDSSDENMSAAEKIIQSLGGGGPDGQTAIRGFFIGIAIGVFVAMICCCWWPCLRMSSRRRRDLLRRMSRRRRRGRQDNTENPNDDVTGATETMMDVDGRPDGEVPPDETAVRDEAYRDDEDYNARREGARQHSFHAEEQGESHYDGERNGRAQASQP